MGAEGAAEQLLAAVTQQHGDELHRLKAVVVALDRLACAMRDVTCRFDDREHPEPPKIAYEALRQQLGLRFPSLGYYSAFTDFERLPPDAEVVVGDALDDLTDIVLEIEEFKWRLRNNGRDDAVWHIQLQYDMHWGAHLRWLQLLLYEKLRHKG